MGVAHLISGQLLGFCYELGILSVEDDAVLGHNLCVQLVVILNLSLLSLSLVLFRNLVAEDLLGICCRSREAFQDETLVHAASAIKLDLDELMKHVIRKSGVISCSVEVRVFLLSILFILGFCLVFQFFDALPHNIPEASLQSVAHANNVFYAEMWNTVHFVELGAEMCLS